MGFLSKKGDYIVQCYEIPYSTQSDLIPPAHLFIRSSNRYPRITSSHILIARRSTISLAFNATYPCQVLYHPFLYLSFAPSPFSAISVRLLAPLEINSTSRDGGNEL